MASHAITCTNACCTWRYLSNMNIAWHVSCVVSHPHSTKGGVFSCQIWNMQGSNSCSVGNWLLNIIATSRQRHNFHITGLYARILMLSMVSRPESKQFRDIVSCFSLYEIWTNQVAGDLRCYNANATLLYCQVWNMKHNLPSIANWYQKLVFLWQIIDLDACVSYHVKVCSRELNHSTLRQYWF